MASRNKTTNYLRLREQNIKVHGVANKPVSHAGELPHPGDKNSYNHISNANLLAQPFDDQHALNLPPDWLARVSDVQHDIQKIQNKMTDLTELHKKHLLPGFDDRTDEEHAVEIMTADITKIFHQAQVKTKRIGSDEKLTGEEKQVKANIQSALASKLQELSQTFRKNQKSYLQTLRSRSKKGKTGSGFINFEEVDIEEFEDKGFSEQALKEAEGLEARVSQREKDIKLIAKSINDLAEVFKDLNVLVIDQGTILDRIDYNLEQTSVYVEEGTQALAQASELQKKYRTKLCIFLLLILVLVMVVVILIKAFAFGK